VRNERFLFQPLDIIKVMPDQMPKIKLFLLGALRLQRNGEDLNIPYQKAEALLAYLAVTGRRHSREWLATLLWGNTDDQRARNSLRNAMYTLRKVFYPEILLAERQFVAIDLTQIWMDIDQLRHLQKSWRFDVDELQQVLNLWRGPFLDGLSISSVPDFDDWLERERRQLEEAYYEGWLNLSKLLMNQGERKAALEAADYLIRLDHFSEPAYRHLMRLHLMNGDRAEALRQYEVMRVRLLDEFGVEPDPVTQTLYHKMLNIPAVRSESFGFTDITPAYIPTSVTFVGRQTELQALSQIWHSVSPLGPARMMLITGEPGIGKTRMVSEWKNHLDDGLFITARCFETETNISYNVWSELLRSANRSLPIEKTGLADVWLCELAHLLPDLHSQRPDLPRAMYDDSELARERLIQAVFQWISALCRIQPVCIFIDDLQWIDQASLFMLEKILRNGSEIPLLVVGAQRIVEAGALWQQAQNSLKRTGILNQIHLHRLSFDEVSTLISALGLSMVAPIQSIQRIFRETEGNPLFVVELVQTLKRMELTTSDKWPVPSTIQGVIRARLSRLTPETREVLALASVIGKSFTPQFLEFARNHTIEDILKIFDEALDANVIIEQVGETYEFSHDKIRSVLYADIPQERRQYLHQQVAQTLSDQRVENINVDFGLIGYHYEAAGDIPAAIAYALRAARRAVELYVDRDALTWYNRALKLSGRNELELTPAFIQDVSPFGQVHISPLLPLDILGLVYRQRGLIYQRTGRYHQAEKDFYAALRRAERRDRVDECGAAHNLLSFLAYLRSEYELVAEHAQNTLDCGTQAQVKQLQAAGLRNLGIAAYHTRDFNRALALYKEAQDVYEDVNDSVGIATCYNNIGFVMRTLRRYREAIAAFEQAYARYKAAGQIEGQAVILANIGRSYAAQGDSRTALDYLERARQLSEETSTDWIAAKIWRTMGRVLSQSEHWDEALEAASKAQALAESLGSDEDLGATYRLLGEIAAAWPGSNLGNPSDYFEQSIYLLEKVGEQHEIERARASFERYQTQIKA
jgi:DNA-binding SARP family transcriptional activator/tetratricopeptide (TPR) repeat protein